MKQCIFNMSLGPIYGISFARICSIVKCLGQRKYVQVKVLCIQSAMYIYLSYVYVCVCVCVRAYLQHL